MNFKRIQRSMTVATAALSAAALLVGCSSSSSPSEPSTGAAAATTLDALYQQAIDQGETTVTVYGPGEAQYAAVYNAFSERFPKIQVKTEFLFGGDLEARLQQEMATGQHVGDVIHLDDAVRYSDILQPYKIVGVEEPSELSAFDGRLHLPALSLYGMAYNKGSVAEADVPSDWAGVVDPAFQAKIGLSNPTSLAATSSVLYSAYKNGAVDKQWFQKLADKRPTLYQSTSQMMGALGSGEINFTPVTYFGFVETQRGQGADIGFAVPKDGTLVTQSWYGLLNGAPHPKATTLLISWLMGQEGQAALAGKAKEYGTMPGAPAPAGLPALQDFKRFDLPKPEEWIAFKTEASTFMKNYFH